MANRRTHDSFPLALNIPSPAFSLRSSRAASPPDLRSALLIGVHRWQDHSYLTQFGVAYNYYWDDADRLTKFDGAGTQNDTTYVYEPGSWQRVKANKNGTVTYFASDKDDLEAEYDGSGNLTRGYVTAGLDDHLDMVTGGSAYYYFGDGLGSVRNVVDSSQTVQDTYDYDAWGNDIGHTTSVSNPMQYTGAYQDSYSGPLYYLRNRYYMPAAGVFASRDAMWADSTKGWGYAEGYPVNDVDPYGEDDVDYSIPAANNPALGAVVGAIAGADPQAFGAYMKAGKLKKRCPRGPSPVGCVFGIAEKRICCSNGSRVVCCDAEAGDSNPAHQDWGDKGDSEGTKHVDDNGHEIHGPLLEGTWGIGRPRTKRGEHGGMILWADLLWMRRNGGYDNYGKPHGNNRGPFGIHQGYSEGCIGCKNGKCFNKIAGMLKNSGQLTARPEPIGGEVDVTQ